VIEQAQFADAGMYTCTGAGGEASVTLNITISGMLLVVWRGEKSLIAFGI